MAPLYDYQCEDGHEFEARASYDEETLPCRALVSRPNSGVATEASGELCGKPARRKGIQRVSGIILQGGGWTRGTTL